MIYEYDMLPKGVVKNILDFYQFCEFTDGSWSGSSKKELKYNEQLLDEAHYPTLVSMMNKYISENQGFNYYFIPSAHTHPNFLRYKEGMHYHWHNDMWIMDGIKTDYSITVCLSEPDDYVGGELEIEVGDSSVEYKLEAGKAVIYHTGLRHRVKPVLSGERNVITWWFTSMINNGKVRDIITEYSRLLAETPMDPSVKWKFENIRQNLIREHATF